MVRINDARCFTLKQGTSRARRLGSTNATELAVSEWRRPTDEQGSDRARAYRENYSPRSRRRPAQAPTHYANRASSSVVYTARGSPTGEHTEQAVQKKVARWINHPINRYQTLVRRRKERPTGRSRASTAPRYMSRRLLYRKPTTVGFARLRVCAQAFVREGDYKWVGGVFTIR